MSDNWQGVRLAPKKWPGEAKVLALAATLKLMLGEEVTVAISTGKKTKYVDLPVSQQVCYYHFFKQSYDYMMMRTLGQ